MGPALVTRVVGISRGCWAQNGCGELDERVKDMGSQRDCPRGCCPSLQGEYCHGVCCVVV